MKWAVDKDYINFDDLERQLDNAKTLIGILRKHYFCHSKEAVIKQPYLLTFEYEDFSTLLSAILNTLDDAQGIFNVIREKHESMLEADDKA